MRINSISVKPERAVNPTLQLSVALTLDLRTEAVLSVTGDLLDREGVILATIRPSTDAASETQEICAEMTPPQRGTNSITVPCLALLSERALARILERRDRHPAKDVELSARLAITTLRPTARVASVHFKDEGVIGPLRSVPPKYQMFYQETSQPYERALEGMWLLSGKPDGKYLAVHTHREERPDIRIPSSDWLTTFCPALGVGRFLTIEYVVPTAPTGASPVQVKLAAALATLQRLQAQLAAGEFTAVVKDSREVWEVCRALPDLPDLLTRDGHSSEAAAELVGVISRLFEFASKLVHRTTRGGGAVLPETKPSREDAEFVYATAAGLLNLLARKLVRHP